MLLSAPSTLDRIYVTGRKIDEPLLAAIDGNRDGMLGGPARKNVPELQADQEYYLLNNRLGSIMALLDADWASRVLECYRYTVYGEATVLPAIDLGDNLNLSAPHDSRQAPSAFGNAYLFTARYYDDRTGLYYYRNRYYEPGTGRFIARNPMGIWGNAMNYDDGYTYVGNRPINCLDPSGLQIEEDIDVRGPLDITPEEFRRIAQQTGQLRFGYFRWIMTVELCCECCKDHPDPLHHTVTIKTISAVGTLHLVPRDAPPRRDHGQQYGQQYGDTYLHEILHSINAEKFYDKEKERISAAVNAQGCEQLWDCLAAAWEILTESIERKALWESFEALHIGGDFNAADREPGISLEEAQRLARNEATDLALRKRESLQVRDNCLRISY